MAPPNAARAAPASAERDPCKCERLPGASTERNKSSAVPRQALPSRATLARRWPSLRLNRFTGAWRDDATGAHGADVVSLLEFIREGAR